jgi:DNA-binding NtrC family response regulator
MQVSILLVDDDKNLLQGVERVVKMERKDVIFSFCSDTLVARLLLEKTKFDAVVSDYRMPGEDGIAFLEYVRFTYPAIKRVLLTGQSENEVYDRAIKVAQRYIAKPCDSLEIIRVVEELLAEVKK